jgi:GT2 family glycosyltransferase
MGQPLVVAVVLSMNRRAETLAWLDSLERLAPARCQVVVLDNASTDGSVESIAEVFPEIEVHRLSENRGYAGNNNVGIDLAIARGADWILLLNDDVVLAPDCLSELLAVAASEPSIGAVGPTVYHADEPAVIQSAGGRLDDQWAARHRGQDERDRGQFTELCSVDWLSGCALMLRRTALEEVGRLDERFFCYWEEVDLCLRISASGRSIVHVPSARVWHSGVRRGNRPSAAVTYYDTRNLLVLLAKHHAPLRVKLANWTRIGWTLATAPLPWARASRSAHPRAILRGALDFVRARYGRMPARRPFATGGFSGISRMLSFRRLRREERRGWLFRW